MKIQLKRSNALDNGKAKEPTAEQMEYGELAVNFNADDPAVFIKDNDDNIIRIGGVGNIADDGQTEIPSNITPPADPKPGNFWYNPDDGRLYYYYEDTGSQGRGASSQWVDASPDSQSNPVESGPTFPATALPDDLFFNTTDGRLYIYYKDSDSEQWVDASPDIQPQTNDLWKRDGTTVLPKTTGDSVEIGGTAEGNGKITLNAADGSGSFSSGTVIGTAATNRLWLAPNNTVDTNAPPTSGGGLRSLNAGEDVNLSVTGATGVNINMGGGASSSNPQGSFAINRWDNVTNNDVRPFWEGVVGGTKNQRMVFTAYDTDAQIEKLIIDPSGSIKFGGTLPSAPNITLNADGNGTFLGDVLSQSPSPDKYTSIQQGGLDVQWFPDGTDPSVVDRLYVGRSTLNIFSAYAGGTPTTSLRRDGKLYLGGDNINSEGTPLRPNIALIGTDGSATFQGQIWGKNGANYFGKPLELNGAAPVFVGSVVADGKDHGNVQIQVPTGLNSVRSVFLVQERNASNTNWIERINFRRNGSAEFAEGRIELREVGQVWTYYPTTSSGGTLFQGKSDNGSIGKVVFQVLTNGEVRSDGKILTRNVELQLEADDDTKYTATTDSEGEQTLVYNGAVLNVKDRLTKLDTALTGLKAALVSTTDHASLKTALIAALADI